MLIAILTIFASIIFFVFIWKLTKFLNWNSDSEKLKIIRTLMELLSIASLSLFFWIGIWVSDLECFLKLLALLLLIIAWIFFSFKLLVVIIKYIPESNKRFLILCAFNYISSTVIFSLVIRFVAILINCSMLI